MFSGSYILTEANEKSCSGPKCTTQETLIAYAQPSKFSDNGWFVWYVHGSGDPDGSPCLWLRILRTMMHINLFSSSLLSELSPVVCARTKEDTRKTHSVLYIYSLQFPLKDSSTTSILRIPCTAFSKLLYVHDSTWQWPSTVFLFPVSFHRHNSQLPVR